MFNTACSVTLDDLRDDIRIIMSRSSEVYQAGIGLRVLMTTHVLHHTVHRCS